MTTQTNHIQRNGATTKNVNSNGDTKSTTTTTVTSSSSLSSTRTLALLRLTFCAVGICTCYLCYGIFHEQLFHKKKNQINDTILEEQQQQFLQPSFILLTQCITNVIVAMIWQYIQQSYNISKVSSSSNTTQQTTTSVTTAKRSLPHMLLLITSICYVIAMICSNEAIVHVSYPVAVLAKSCKLIPTMIVGQCVSYSSKVYNYYYNYSRHANGTTSQSNDGTILPNNVPSAYRPYEWIAACFISVGIVLFHYNSPSFHIQNHTTNVSEEQHQQNNTMLGIYLLCTSLLMDGILSACQNIIKQSLHPPNAVQTMLYINLYAIGTIGIFCYYMGQLNWIYDVYMYYITTTSTMNDNIEHTSMKIWNIITIPVIPSYYMWMIRNVCILNIAAALGQIFIFITITWYTPVITTMITTTRKFITIVISVLVYGHSFTYIQWSCIIFIFIGLYIAIIGTTNDKNNNAPKQSDTRKKNE